MKKPARAARPASKKTSKKTAKDKPKKVVETATRSRAKPSAKKPGKPAKRMAARADLGAPIDGFFTKQPPHLRAILDELRKLVDEAMPDASSSIKWGMPFYTLGDQMVCALAGFKAHVNLILAGPPDTFADPTGLLEGDAKGGRHLKLRSIDDLPVEAVRGWLRTAVRQARAAG